jgi:hypothetical protein
MGRLLTGRPHGVRPLIVDFYVFVDGWKRAARLNCRAVACWRLPSSASRHCDGRSSKINNHRPNPVGTGVTESTHSADTADARKIRKLTETNQDLGLRD